MRGSYLTQSDISCGIFLLRWSCQNIFEFAANASSLSVSWSSAVETTWGDMRPMDANCKPASLYASSIFRTRTALSPKIPKYGDSPLRISAIYSNPIASDITPYVWLIASNDPFNLPEATLIVTNFLFLTSKFVSFTTRFLSESKSYPRINGKHLSQKIFIWALIE